MAGRVRFRNKAQPLKWSELNIISPLMFARDWKISKVLTRLTDWSMIRLKAVKWVACLRMYRVYVNIELTSEWANMTVKKGTQLNLSHFCGVHFLLRLQSELAAWGSVFLRNHVIPTAKYRERWSPVHHFVVAMMEVSIRSLKLVLDLTSNLFLEAVWE